MVLEQIPAAGVAMSVAGAAASVGLTPATLRTWDRRYGLSPSVRTAGGHRRYNSSDLTRLRLTARMVDEGLPPAGSARAVIAWTIQECERRLGSNEHSVDENPTGEQSPPAPTPAPRAGGGRSLSMAAATAEQRGMARAAMALDGAAVRKMMTTAMADRGVVRAWDELAAPTLIAIGNRWSNTGTDVEVEHVASLAIQQALDVETAADPTGRPVLLACAPEDRHALALLALRAALIERETPVVMLGPQLPTSALVAAAGRLRPRAIVLWASMTGHADPAALAEVPRRRPPVRLYVAGPGWAAVDVSTVSAQVLRSLSAAVDELT